MHNEDIYDPSNIIRVKRSVRMGWAGRVACMGVKKVAYMTKPEDKGPLWNPERNWEDNIKIGLQEIRWEADWIDFAQHRE